MKIADVLIDIDALGTPVVIDPFRDGDLLRESQVLSMRVDSVFQTAAIMLELRQSMFSREGGNVAVVAGQRPSGRPSCWVQVFGYLAGAAF
jgi:hypothetical protein